MSMTSDTWNMEEAEFRLALLMRIMFYCARWGRVHEQILAFGIPKDIDRTSHVQTSAENGIDDDTEIPEEELILYPVAARAPTAHSQRMPQEVKLQDSLMSHPLSASTLLQLPDCFHVALKENLSRIRKEGLIPGGNGIHSRTRTFFNPLAPWDQRSWRVTRVSTRVLVGMSLSISQPRLRLSSKHSTRG